MYVYIPRSGEWQKGEKMSKKDYARNPDGTFAPGHTFSEKYEDDFAVKLEEFFSKPITRIEYEEQFDSDGNVKSRRPIEMVEDFPTFGMFARSIGVSVSAIKAWAGITENGKYKKPQFASAYARAKGWAEGMLESGGITGKLNANMVKFVLTNDYGKEDKQIIQNSAGDVDEKTLELIRKVEARLRDGESKDKETD